MPRVRSKPGQAFRSETLLLNKPEGSAFKRVDDRGRSTIAGVPGNEETDLTPAGRLDKETRWSLIVSYGNQLCPGEVDSGPGGMEKRMPEIVCRIIEVCVFKIEKNQPRYLLLQRSKNDRIYPGIWQWVTGTIREGERAVQAAIRELNEETGLTPGRLWAVPHVNSFYVAADDTVHVSPFFAAEVAPDTHPRLSSEHQSWEWCAFERSCGLLVWPGQRRGLEIVHQFIVGQEEAARLTQLPI